MTRQELKQEIERTQTQLNALQAELGNTCQWGGHLTPHLSFSFARAGSGQGLCFKIQIEDMGEQVVLRWAHVRELVTELQCILREEDERNGFVE